MFELLTAEPARLNCFTVEKAIMSLYPLNRRTPADVARLLEVRPDHVAVRATLSACDEAALIRGFLGSVPYSDVQALAARVVAL